jgi:arsenate reductase
MDKLLRESGVPFEKVNYYVEPLSKKKLTELVRKLNLKPRELLRKGEAIYKELGLGERELSDSELIALMVEHPDLLQRPIVERGDRAVLGGPTENVKELL